MGKRLLACFMAAVLAFPSYGVFAETSAENEKTETVIEQEDSSGRQASDDFDIDEITSDGSDEDAVAGSSSEDADIEDAEYVSPEEEQEETDEEETADAEEAEEEIVEVDGEAHTASDEAMNAEGDGEDPGVEEGTEEPDPEADIPDDATYWCGHYYKSYSSVGISPDSARAACESMGGYLATFTSKAELTFLSNYLDNSTPYTSIYNVDYIINSVSDLGDNYLQWPTGETYRYGDGYVYSRFLGENGPSTSGTGQSVLHHIRYNNTDGNATYWGRENYNKLLTTIDSLTGKPKLDVRGYVCEWGPTQMELTAEDMSLDTEVYRYSSSTSSYKPNVTVKYNVVSETLEKNNDYLLQYISNSSPGIARARITGQGRFTGVAEKAFYITPGNISNLTASAGEDGIVLLSWSGGDGNSGFEVQCSTESTFPEDEEKTKSIFVNTTNAEITPPSVSGLLYYARVRSITNNSTEEGRKAWGAWSAVQTLPGFVELDYLEVGFGGDVTVHWKNDGATSTLSGYQIQHRFAETGDPMTTTVSGYTNSSKLLTSLSYNDYEIRIRSYKGSGTSQLYSPWSGWAKCPVKEIKILNPDPGNTHVDPYDFTAIIDFGVTALNHDGELSILDSNNTKIQSIPFKENVSEEGILSKEVRLPKNTHFSLSSAKASHPDSLLEKGKTYHAAINEKAIEYLDNDSEPYDIPVYFVGIQTTDKSRWSFTVESTSFPGLENSGAEIDYRYYQALFKDQDWPDIRALDDGTNGHCVGLSYIVGAYKNNYSRIKSIASDYGSLASVPINEGSKLLEYEEIAHLAQYRPDQRTVSKVKYSISDMYNAIKSGKSIAIGIKNALGGHRIYPIAVLDDTSLSNITILVYDSAAPAKANSSVRSFLHFATLSKDGSDWNFSYSTASFNYEFMSYYIIDNSIDAYCKAYSEKGDITKYGNQYYLITADGNINWGNSIRDKIDSINPFNGSNTQKSIYAYWTEESSFHYDGTDQPITLTFSDGTNKLYVTLAAHQSATLDIENNKVTIDPVSSGGAVGDYEIRFSHADDYDTFHDTVIQGTSGNSGTTLQKVDDQIEIQTDGGTNLTVSNEENGHSTGATTVNLSDDNAVIRTDDGKASVFVDKDGDGNYTDREEPVVPPTTDPATDPNKDNTSGRTDSKPTSGTAGIGSKTQAVTITKGKAYVVDGQTYKVTKVAAGSSAGTVTFIKAKNAKNVTVPAAVMLEDGKTYQVTQVGAKAFTAKKIRKVTVGANIKKLTSGAFSKSKATTVIIKTKKLGKAGVKGSLKGSKVSKVQVKIGAKKINKKYVKSYQKIFTKKNAGKKVSIK